MTSNIGADKFSDKKRLGFMNTFEDDSLQEKLRSFFKEEFINRIDEIILFSDLDISALKQIAKIRLSEIFVRLNSFDIFLDAEEEVYDFIAKAGRKKGFGARPINRIITSQIENKIAQMLVDGTLLGGDSIMLSVRDEKILCSKKTLAKK